MRFRALILFTIFFSVAVCAQKQNAASDKKVVKKAIASARANIKKGSGLAEAEYSMRNLLKDSANLDNEKIWFTLFDAVKKQYEQLNENLYLKQQSDTAKFFVHTLHMFDVLESLDSVNAKLDKTGKSTPSYRKKHASFLDQYRTNLFGGGGYYLQKQDYKNAYNFFKAYLDCAEQPLFEGFDYTEKDARMPDAAYWAVFCGYKLEKPEIIDKYTELASRNPKTDVYLQQYKAESYLLKGDSANYCTVLENGFYKYADNAYFFPHLVVYYAEKGMHDKVLEISQRALETDPHNLTALLARSSALLHKERYDECIKICDQVIAIDENQPIVYLNAGLAYYNQSVPLASKKIQTKEDKAKIAGYYKRALPYLSKYRQMKPDDKAMWISPLYNIYLNLNMGDEFEEIEKLLIQ
jgi:hypothetical protein